ncbi:membrane protein [Clostridium polyendosporum]|uniref:Membrane protein n=1 Tax=Clostridium polyendosporum TaxID=69208 RepID=A0A919VGC3_9CLOT|nr:YidC/Oxa1 family membrane protein insertase [Clostridium polyendosporum]GIM29042.1 membrane protein [Clostridium polyendosporum]
MNIISNILDNLLSFFFTISGDWGIAITFLTVFIRVILLPLSIKQKVNIEKNQDLYKSMEEIRKIYKNNKGKLETEMQKLYKQNIKGMLVNSVGLLQIPIVLALYNVILKMPVQESTLIIPWVTSIKMIDSYLIVPVIYTLIILSPYLLSYIPFFKTSFQAKVSKANLIFTSIFSILITFKTPIAVGIYFITTGFFSLVEEVVFRLYLKK